MDEANNAQSSLLVVGLVYIKDVDMKVPWKLRITSPNALAIKNDTEREEREASIRASWEHGQSGRAMRAKRTRDKYLKARKENPETRHSAINQKIDWQKVTEDREAKLQEFNQYRERVEREREQQRLRTIDRMQTVSVEFEQLRREYAQLQSEEAKKREVFVRVKEEDKPSLKGSRKVK